ncbi:MAG TPA: hypothetical protein VF843_09330 [Streptosporangiaceae bacterium]
MTGGPAREPGRWLLACYPRGWRQRYAAEFTELLAAERAELGRSWRRDGNVAAAGLRARLAAAGLVGHPLDPDAAARAGLGTIAASLSAAVIAGVASWARIAIGLQWSAPATPGIGRSMDLMSAALLLLATAGLLAAVPVAWAVLAAIARRQSRELRRPAAMIAAGAAVLVIGGRHVQNGWPGTGGHLLVHQGLVPGLAAFGWAVTMWVTSYWAHPSALAAFPAGQLAWLAVSPAATACLVAGMVQLGRRLPLSARSLRYQATAALLGGTGAALLAAGTLSWLSDADSGPVRLFRAGTIGQACLAVIAIAAVTGGCAARRSWSASRNPAGTVTVTRPGAP